MDQATIQQIAAEVARSLPSYSWTLLLIQVLLTLIAAGVGAFFGEYLKTRGKNLAIKADLESIKAQLSATTEAVETVKAEIGQRDWAKRERANLRRIKVEAMLAAMHDCEAYLMRFRSRAMTCELPEDRDPSIELSTAIVYLPELRTQVDDYVNVYLEECVALRNLSLELATTLQLDAQQQPVARQRIYDGYRMDMLPRYKRILVATRNLRGATSKFLVDIMGVEEGSHDNHSEVPTETH